MNTLFKRRYVLRKASLPITFFAHSGKCTECDDGLVKMSRDPKTFELQPDNCLCLNCGQKYHVEVENLEKFEEDQWIQKGWKNLKNKLKLV